MKNKKSAFTLAEVLLVLAIIGVIAAVTIPAVMQQSSEKKFAALAKKAQSTLQNAIDLKFATVPIGPGDMGFGLLQWLIDGEEDGTNTLKAAKTDNASNARTIQTPDGMIIHLTHGQTCNTASTNTNRIPCYTEIYIDLNASDGPTNTTVNNAATTLTASGYSNKTAYDTIILIAATDGKIRPCAGGSLVCTRAMKYLGIDKY